MAARANGDPLQMVHFYNITHAGDASTVPSSAMFANPWRFFLSPHPPDLERQDVVLPDFTIGQHVVVKPVGSRCTVLWNPGVITSVNGVNNVSVDGVPRHVRDVRVAPVNPAEAIVDVEAEPIPPRPGEDEARERPRRVITLPRRLQD